MARDDTRYHRESTIFRISPLVNSKDGVVFAMLFAAWSSLSASDFTLRATTGQNEPIGRPSPPATAQHVGKVGGIQIFCSQGIAVGDYSVNFEAIWLLQRWGYHPWAQEK